MHNLNELARAVKNGHNIQAVLFAKELLSEEVSIELIVEKGLTEPLNSLSSKCTTEDFNLLEIMLAGRAMMDVMDIIAQSGKSIFAESPDSRIVLGTIKGDIHDLGRNVVNTIFTLAGFKVIDLGKDVAPEKFVDAAIEHKASYIAISSLVTLTADYVKGIRALAHSKGMDKVKIVAGGAGFRLANKQYLQVDYVATDVFDGLNYILANGRRSVQC